MKKRLICMLTVLALLLALVPSVAAAEKPDFSGDCGASIRWELDPAEGVLTFTGSGPMPDYSYGSAAPWNGLRNRIFTAVLSEGITSIGAYAFNECYRLTAIDASACTLSAIGEGAMNNCPILETVSFTPAAELSVGADAFFGCEALTAIDLGAEKGTVGSGALSGCTALESVALPAQLARLEDNTLSGCAALTELELPENLTYIGKNCFRGCVALAALTIPATVSEVERYAFQGCGSLTLTFLGDAPEFAPADDISSSFLPAATLHVPFGADGWEWPICGGYSVEYVYPSLDGVFHDLEKNAWYIPSVQHVYYMGLMNGMREGEFAPRSAMTRGQLVTVLFRMAGEPEVESANPFTDVKDSAYYYDAVCWAHSSEIVSGLTADTFGPESKVSRQQMCTILYRYAGSLGLDLSVRDTLQDFKDTDKLDTYARDPMGWCVAMGLINGKPGSLLDPRGSATRAEIAKVLTTFAAYQATEEYKARNAWEKEYDVDPGPDIDREDPLYLYAREIFDDINKSRTAGGLKELAWNDYLFQAAQTRAEELAGENGFGHTRPDGSSYSTVFTQFGITCNIRNEIIAHGYTTAQSLVDVWSSAGSTSPVINAVVYNTAAVGVYQAPPAEDGEEGKYYYALLVFG